MKSFKSLGVCDELISTLQKQGIKEPTPIQEQSIPIVFKGNDIIAKAQTGTGKTLAFLLPILQRIHTDVHQEQVLIIAPTRELIKQISDEAKVLGAVLDVDILPLIGGKTIESQLQQLGRRPHVILGTPGRLLDHAKRGSLHLDSIRRVVLDEADQMLHMGFLPDIENLIGQTDANRQLLLFSATIPDKIRNLAKAYMTKPVSVRAEGKHITLDSIDQRVYMMNPEDKTPRLIKMIQEDNPYLAIVFCNKREGAIRLSYELTAAGLNIAEMHGDLTQGRRTQILRDFAKAKTQILVATDIAARGIDIEGITHVYNYDVPHDVDYFIHRIGRTGRANREGKAYTIVVGKEERYLKEIERKTKSHIEKLEVPTLTQIHQHKVTELMYKLEDMILHGEHKPMKDLVNQIENHMLKDTVICIDSDLNRTRKVYQALEEICYEFDLSKPLWLDHNKNDFIHHSKTRFNSDSFVEDIDFDFLEIQVIEED